MINTLTKNRGFTLLEILLYMLIASGILFAITSFALQIMEVSKKSSDMQEIETNIDYVSNKLSSIIKSANSIDSGNSTFGNDLGKLSLNVPDGAKSPTVLYLENEAVYLKEGVEDEIKITSDFVKCTQLKFVKVTTAKSPDQVVFDMQCEPINSDLAALKQELSIHTTISLRK